MLEIKLEWRNPNIQLIEADGTGTFDNPTAVGGTITYADGLYGDCEYCQYIKQRF